MADKIDTIVTAVMCGVLGIVLICSVAIPVVTGQLAGLTEAESNQYGSLISVVIVMMIVGLIIAVVKFFNGSGREKR